MSHNKARTSGLTYLEILIVVGILIIISASISPFYSNFILRVNTDLAADLLIGSIRKAQNYSMDAKNNTIWGVCMSGSSIRLYTGSCASPILKEDTPISNRISVSGLTSVTFSKFRGEPSSAQTISIRSDIETRTITVNAAGGVNVQ